MIKVLYGNSLLNGWVVFFVVVFLLGTGILSFPSWLLGTLLGIILLKTYKNIISKKYSKISNELSSLFEIEFEEELKIRIKENDVKSIIEIYAVLVFIFSNLFTLVSIGYMLLDPARIILNYTRHEIPDSEYDVIFLVIGAIVITNFFIVLIEPREKLSMTIKEHIHSFVDYTQNQISKLNDIISENFLLAESISINLEYDGLISRMNSDLKNNLYNLDRLNSTIKGYLDTIQLERQELKKVISKLKSVENLYNKILPKIIESGSQSKVNYLDRIHEYIFQIKIKFIPCRDWVNFDRALEKIKYKLEKLDSSSAEISVEVNDELITNPYVVLGLITDPNEDKSNITNEHISMMYRTLAKIFHPDTGTNKDDKKMKKINDAYHKLKKERGF